MSRSESDSRYNRSEKGKARYARYRKRHWQRVETARLRWNQMRRERRLNGLGFHSQD